MGCKLALRVSIFSLFVAVGGCSSSNVSDKQDEIIDTDSETSLSILRAQAIDGYIVGGDVYCDEQRNGLTEIAGWLACDAGTSLISVEGGRDIGFDETAANGGTAFNGKLQGPGGVPYITPLTTIATLMSVSNGVFDRALYDSSVVTLGERLGIVNLDLTSNPATTVELARANAQINTLAVQFAATVSDYELAMEAIAETILLNPSVDLTDSVANISAINEILQVSAPHLALNPEAQAVITDNVDVVIAGIEQAELVDEIDTVVKSEELPVAFQINRTAPLFRYTSINRLGFSDNRAYSLNDFEKSTAQDNSFITQFGVSGWNRQLTFSSDAFVIARSVQNANVDVAVDVQSIRDDRRLSVTVRGVQLSMIQNDPTSIDIQVPEGTVMHATYVEESGVVTNVSNTAVENLIASSADGNFSVNLSSIERSLENHGYANFFKEFGDYQMTLVLDGINFGLVESDLLGNATETTPSAFTVNTSVDSVTGLGLQGFLSLIDI